MTNEELIKDKVQDAVQSLLEVLVLIPPSDSAPHLRIVWDSDKENAIPTFEFPAMLKKNPLRTRR
jgi:hypothetical protein